jgi:hypothetical protein
MKRMLIIGATTIVVCCGVIVLAQARYSRAMAESRAAVEAARSSMVPSEQGALPNSITESPSWRPITDDLGLMLEPDPRLKLRARLYVRMNDMWFPVAIEGPEDIGGIIPAE